MLGALKICVYSSKTNMSWLNDLLERLLNEAGITVNGTTPADIQIHNDKLWRAIALRGSLGLGEAYMNGWWDAEPLDAFFSKLLRAKMRIGISDPTTVMARLAATLVNPQTRRRSTQVAEQHYNLGNSFYSAWLDPYMQYTCAYWAPGDDLAAAQYRKLDLVCRKLQLQPGQRVLELGCGWGGFARFACEHYGVQVEAYNISTEQVAFARERCAEKDLPATFHLNDYREATGTFDRVVSIGMLEHVGEKNYRAFFELIRERLKPDGLALVHSIGCNETKRTSDPWFHKYIFPGGQLPSLVQLTSALEQVMAVEDVHNFGTHYDKTLMAWFERFNSVWPQFAELYGERFYRMWKYYLLSCAGSFRARNIQLWQFVLSPLGHLGGYDSVR